MAAGYTHEEAKTRAVLLEMQSYEIFLDLASDPSVIRSRAEIRFRCWGPGVSSYANLAAGTVHQIQLNGQALDPADVLVDGCLHLTGLTADNVLTVDAESGYPADGRGLGRFTDPADGSVYVLATCFPNLASRLLCCFDQPDLRADVTLSVSAPAGWECVSSGAVTARPESGQAGVWRFATVPAMKIYELILCAGPYVTAAEGNLPGQAAPIPLSVRSRRTLAHEPGLAKITTMVGTALAFYERILGVPCPYPKYDVVFAPGLNANAMQVPALMLVSERLLQRAADPEDTVALILAHEVAHLWFGCLVEGRWWDDLWLAEAMADYLGDTAGDEAFHRPAAWARYGMRTKPQGYEADSAPGVEPVSSPVEDAADGLSKPWAITYVKGGSVVRQLAALIGDAALRTGLHDYLTSFGWSAATLDDLMGCWSRASGRDLTEWAEQWLRTPGVNTLRPELTLAPDGTIASLSVRQDPLPARTHRISIGLYGRQGGRLHRRHRIYLEMKEPRTAAPELTGLPAPDALILNDQDLTFAIIRFDDRSLRNLTECAMQVDDPLAEAVCWTAAWDMTMAAELAASDFTDLVIRRIAAEPVSIAVDTLLQRARTAADYYAPPGQRPALRQRLAAAILDTIGRTRPASRTQRQLAAAFAASAETEGQLTLLRSWLAGASLPDGVSADLDLRAQILATLSARGLASDNDLDAYAAADPVGGQLHAATCRAMRPDPAAKKAAWVAALDADQTLHLARAHATGIWVPGQDAILAPYQDRYFSEALPALSHNQTYTGLQLAGLLYPATPADPVTLDATTRYLAGSDPFPALRRVLLDQARTLGQTITAQAKAAREG
ncbi:MAG TPA: aminopeptidase N [Streptosporangiaceae bacterium]